jgi:hypothetical protein
MALIPGNGFVIHEAFENPLARTRAEAVRPFSKAINQVPSRTNQIYVKKFALCFLFCESDRF